MMLEELRRELDQADEALLEAAARRQALVEKIGRLKQAEGRATRDFEREKVVIERARERAERLGLEPELAEDLLRLLIEQSLTRQEQDRVEAQGQGDGRRALIIGGAGRMGQWFARFLASQGFAVDIADPSGPVDGFGFVEDWQADPLGHDVIVVAAPLRASADVLQVLAERVLEGLIFDIGSLKGPLEAGLQTLAEAGARVTSVHPMFGPDAELLSGRHIIFVDVGHAGAVQDARALFEPTMAEQVEMSLEEHDRVMAFVLGLSHALNITFFDALASSGKAAPDLARISSTTFDQQLRLARQVASENPHLYFEIQALNAFGDEALERLTASAERLRRLVRKGDEERFVEVMKQGRVYFE